MVGSDKGMLEELVHSNLTIGELNNLYFHERFSEIMAGETATGDEFLELIALSSLPGVSDEDVPKCLGDVFEKILELNPRDFLNSKYEGNEMHH